MTVPSSLLRKPDFLIIGAQRSASSYLHHCFREHPGLYLPRDEVVYFEDPAYGRRDPDLLHRVFSRARPDQMCGFKRPELLARPECPERIARDLPGVKLLAVLREPLSRTVSAYFHYVLSRVVPVAPLNEGLRRILRGELDDRFPQAKEIVDYSLYGAHLRRFLDHFERSCIHVALDDDFQQDAPAALREAFSFLEVDADFTPATGVARPNAGVYSLPRIRLLRLGSRFVYSYRPGSAYIAARLRSPFRGVNRLVRSIDRLLLEPIFGNEPPALQEDVRSKLATRILPDLDYLEPIVGRSLDHWRRRLV